MEFKNMSMKEIITEIKSGKTTSKEVFDYFLDRIEKYDDKLQCFNYINKEGLNQNTDWKLAWIPIAVKDIFCEKWIPTTASSLMLEDFIPPYDSTVIKNLKEEWMSSIWKVTMDEFAMGSTGENSASKIAVNPWGNGRIPGGSSSGSASAVAGWLVPAALWTDTGWSIRQPASLCWIVWFKPSYGRNSRYWVIPMASSFDCPWTLTKTVEDAAILYNIMNWEDRKENTSIVWKDIIDPKIWNTKDLKWFKLWVPKEYFEEWIDEGVKQTLNKAIEDLKNMWAEIKPVSLPMTKYAIAAYYIIVPAEVSTNLWRLDWIRYWHISKEAHSSMDEMYQKNRWEWLGLESTSRSIIWSYVLSSWFYDAYYKKASQVRTLIIEDFNKVYEEVDALITPASPSVAWKIWEKNEDPLKLYLADSYTIPASLAWLPWICIPAWFAQSEDSEKETLPVWLQILAPRLEEQKLFTIANIFEKNTPWKDKMNPEK